jgi:hypothetical protein
MIPVKPAVNSSGYVTPWSRGCDAQFDEHRSAPIVDDATQQAMCADAQFTQP